jgi:tetratricopeptide (TPR) repeat protein
MKTSLYDQQRSPISLVLLCVCVLLLQMPCCLRLNQVAAQDSSVAKAPDQAEKSPPPIIVGPASAAEVYKRVSPSVVMIYGHNNQGEIVSQGSGFLVSDTGVIATNRHVVEDAKSLTVRAHDFGPVPCRTVSLSNAADLALVYSERLKGRVPLCDVHYLPPIGAKVYAIGNPQGLASSLSEGIISGYRDTSEKVRLIQMTAPISPGSSGCPIVDDWGMVIGVAQGSLRDSQNLNFAVPVIQLWMLQAELRETHPHLVGLIDSFPACKALQEKAMDLVSEGAKGSFEAREKKYFEAVALLETATRLDNLDSKTYLLMSLIYDFLAQIEEKTTLTAQNGDYFDRKRSTKEYTYRRKALAFAERGLATNPHHTMLWMNVVAQYRGLGREDRVREVMERAICLSPEEPRFRSLLASAYMHERRYDDAISQLEAAIKLETETETVPSWLSHYYTNLGAAYSNTGNWDGAARAYRKLIAVATDDRSIDVGKKGLEKAMREGKQETGP